MSYFFTSPAQRATINSKEGSSLPIGWSWNC